MRFGRLQALRRAEPVVGRDGRKRSAWVCRCDCGSEITAITDNLVAGRTRSCGCLRNEESSKRLRGHGMSDTRLYAIWNQMKQRCYNANTLYYENYGGRGITICEPWRENFIAFYDWAMQNGYQDGLTIDRINNDFGYCPDNCQWVDSVAQANNRRSNRRYEINGETHNVTEWANLRGVNPKLVFERLYAGWDIEGALDTHKHN